MTPVEKLIADAHRDTQTRRKPTKAEILLAERLAAAMGEVSWGFIRATPERVPELDLDHKEPVS
jgi:hypothetical protein